MLSALQQTILSYNLFLKVCVKQLLHKAKDTYMLAMHYPPSLQTL